MSLQISKSAPVSQRILQWEMIKLLRPVLAPCRRPSEMIALAQHTQIRSSSNQALSHLWQRTRQNLNSGRSVNRRVLGHRAPTKAQHSNWTPTQAGTNRIITIKKVQKYLNQSFRRAAADQTNSPPDSQRTYLWIFKIPNQEEVLRIPKQSLSNF